MKNQEKMEITQKHCEIVAKAIQFAEQGGVEGWEDQYLDPKNSFISHTRDDLDSFGRGWVEAEGWQQFDVEGYECEYWASMQALKGQTRASLTVVDFGHFRVCYHCA